MKKIFILPLIACAAATSAFAQSAIDAYNIAPTEMRGTARFMSMGGAFTSLGGDLSVMTQNPAGLGLYRKSEIGATLDVDVRRYTTTTESDKLTSNQVKVYCNNFGYIGSTRLSGAMKYLQWGVSYNRINSFDRTFTGYNLPTSTSLTNYIASYTNGVPSGKLNFDNGYNPYTNSSEDWLSILAYNSYLINNTGSDTQYKGLYQNGTVGDALYTVTERGYTDEYNISFAGNIEDLVFWGVGVGIYDQAFQRETSYSESMEGADCSTKYDDFTGNAGFELSNYQRITSSGANIKVGLIVKPINELRIGAAIHTPTWLTSRTVSQGATQYRLFNPDAPQNGDNPFEGKEDTDYADYNWRLNTPWRFMVGASAVLGGQAIVSVDYERAQYPDMTVSYQTWNGWNSQYVSDNLVNGDIKNYFRASNTVRIGAEYRVTPQFSVRAGYNYSTSDVQQKVADGAVEVMTAGTDPSFILNKDTQRICVGLGYRYKYWYIDAAYVHDRVNSTFHAYTNFAGNKAPGCELTNTYNSIVLSTGFKF